MKKTVLLFHISAAEQQGKIRKALLPLRIEVKSIPKEHYKQSIGYLSGNPKMPKTDELYDGEDVEGQMMLLSGISGTTLGNVLDALKKEGAGRDCLKAVLTDANASWDVLHLYKEIKLEHDLMNGRT